MYSKDRIYVNLPTNVTVSIFFISNGHHTPPSRKSMYSFFLCSQLRPSKLLLIIKHSLTRILGNWIRHLGNTRKCYGSRKVKNHSQKSLSSITEHDGCHRKNKVKTLMNSQIYTIKIAELCFCLANHDSLPKRSHVTMQLFYYIFISKNLYRIL